MKTENEIRAKIEVLKRDWAKPEMEREYFHIMHDDVIDFLEWVLSEESADSLTSTPSEVLRE